MCCKNRHLWLDQEDAEKCCSGRSLAAEPIRKSALEWLLEENG
jgi:hypothetical protein